MMLRPKGEGSSFRVAFGFKDAADEPVVMNSVKYRIDCITTGTTVRDWTQVTPAEEMELLVESTDNEMFRDRNKREQRMLSIVGNDDQATQFVDPDPYVWWVVNTLPGKGIVP